MAPDKLLHLVGHAGYAVLLADAFGSSRRPDGEAAVLAVCTSTVLSLVAGRLQHWAPGRAFEPADVVAGLIGSLLAVSRWYAVSDARATGRR
jgi:VanZ family protein